MPLRNGQPSVRSVLYSLVCLFVLAAALAVAGLFWTAHEVNYNNAAQARQGAAIEKKLCATLHALDVLRPPAGPASTNPARGYDQELHRTLAQIYPDLGCGTAPKVGSQAAPPAAAPAPSQPVTVSHPGATVPKAPVVFTAAVPATPAPSPEPSPSPAPSATTPAPSPSATPAPVVSVPGVISVSPPCVSVLVLNVCL